MYIIIIELFCVHFYILLKKFKKKFKKKKKTLYNLIENYLTL